MEQTDRKFTKNVKAYIQIKPNMKESWEYIKILKDQKTMFVRSWQDFSKGKNNVIPNFWVYKTDGVLLNTDPAQFFNLHIKESLKKAIEGTDALIFAYGQTGTGKSSTTHGVQESFDSRGLIPRIITELINLKEAVKYESYIQFHVSYVEVTKSHVLDLLQKNKIIHNPYKSIKLLKMKTEIDGLKRLFRGEVQRNTCFDMYVSNINTSVFTIHISNLSRLKSNPVAALSKIHIIDMAGMDTDGNSSCQMKNASEVGLGNLNKSQLEQCLMAIKMDVIHNKSSVVDAGILVDYLGKSLKAHSIIKFIGHIRTSREDLPVTLSTLRLANMARCIKSAKLKQIKEEVPSLMLASLQSEIEYLKQQIDLNSMLMNNDLSYNITQTRIQQMENAVEDYIKSKSNNLVLLNVTDAKVAVSIFKEVCTKLAEEIIEVRKQIPFETKISVKSNNSNSKGSVPSDQHIEQKALKLNKSKSSRESQASGRKRKSTDKSSRMSKLSIQSKNKNSGSGSLSKSGLTIGQLMSYDYEGDVTKTLKIKSKIIQKPSIDVISEEICEKSFTQSLSKDSTQLSEVNLQTELGDDFQTAWDAYAANDNYTFEKLNDTLMYLERTTKNILKEFNVLLEKLQQKVHQIDTKKSDLLQIQVFISSNLQCGSFDRLKLKDSEEQITVRLVHLINDTVILKERLLKLQSEMKIHIDEYHRIKENIMKEFADFCSATYKIKLPPTEQQIMESIEDKMIYTNEGTIDKDKSKVSFEQNYKSAYYKYQQEMKRLIEKRRFDEHKDKKS